MKDIDPLTDLANYQRMARAVSTGDLDDDALLAMLMRSLFDADRCRMDNTTWAEGRMSLVAAQVTFLELLARLSGMEVKMTARFGEVYSAEEIATVPVTEPDRKPFDPIDIPVFGRRA